MNIIVNNRERIVPDDYSIKQLLEDMNLTNSVAIWINDQRLLQKEYKTYKLKDKDKVKIFKPIGGG